MGAALNTYPDLPHEATLCNRDKRSTRVEANAGPFEVKKTDLEDWRSVE